jgi:enamine deaminase RidA (YjgF/YER057c/UK114 family)
MTHRRFNPPSIAAPGGAYSHGVECAPNLRWLHAAGQVGMRPDGTTPKDGAEEVEAAWSNVLAVLAGAGMAAEDVVRVTTYVTTPDVLPPYRAARTRLLGEHKPASTLIQVAALARPEWHVEIEVTAAKG